jgi:hypothetical protein
VNVTIANDLAILNCVIANNSATFSGGGMNIGGDTGNHVVNIVASQFFKNATYSASGGGLAIAAVTLASSNIEVTNCLFHNNIADTTGGGMRATNSNARVHGCTFTANSASTGGGGIALSGTSASAPVFTIRNCILWDNTSTSGSPEIFLASGTTQVAAVTYSDVEGGFTGTGNDNANPLFVDPDGPDNIAGTLDDNYRLQCLSPALNAGDPNSGNSPGAGTPGIPEDTEDANANSNFSEKAPDRALNTRMIGVVDMGAFERIGPDNDVVCLGDLNADCVVNVDDLLFVINNWGTGGNPYADGAPAPCGDGSVNVDDLLLVINNWGACEGCVDTSGVTLQDADDCMDAASLEYTPYSDDWDYFVEKCVDGLRAAGLIE